MSRAAFQEEREYLADAFDVLVQHAMTIMTAVLVGYSVGVLASIIVDRWTP